MAVIIKSDTGDELIVMGEIYVPLSVDTDDDAIMKAEVQKMAYDFMASGRVNKIDVNHNLEESGCTFVELFIARKGDPDFKEGSWVGAARITDKTLKEKVHKGELNGFSFYSDELKAVMVEDVPIIRTKRLAGTTEKSDVAPEHDHTCVMEFDDDALVIPTYTGETNGHRHRVTKTTATDAESGHSHRLVY